MEEEIKISEMPANIKTDGIEMAANECINISYQVAKKNPEVEIIEGVVITFDNENGAKAIAHMWNRFEGVDFDVTSENIWKDTDEMNDTIDNKYYQIQINELSSFKVGELNDFSEETKINVEEINKIILKKAKK